MKNLIIIIIISIVACTTQEQTEAPPQTSIEEPVELTPEEKYQQIF